MTVDEIIAEIERASLTEVDVMLILKACMRKSLGEAMLSAATDLILRKEGNDGDET